LPLLLLPEQVQQEEFGREESRQNRRAPKSQARTSQRALILTAFLLHGLAGAAVGWLLWRISPPWLKGN